MQKIKFVDKKIPATARVAGYILNSKVSNSGALYFPEEKTQICPHWIFAVWICITGSAGL